MEGETKGVKNWDNCNSIINKSNLKKIVEGIIQRAYSVPGPF